MKVSRKRMRAIMAHEEAAHAVIARKLGVEVLYVAMFPTDEEAAAATPTVSAAHHVARDTELATRIAAYEKDAVIALAGRVAHGRVHRRSARIRGGSDPDINNALSVACHITILQAGQPEPELAPGERVKLPDAYREVAFATLDRLWLKTEAMVTEHWPVIERVAAVLIDRDYLDAIALERIIATSAQA